MIFQCPKLPSWFTCNLVHSLAIKEITCDGSTLSNRSVFVISKGSVDAPQTLVFQLKVEKGNRSAIARQKLVFVAGNLPQIAVRYVNVQKIVYFDVT